MRLSRERCSSDWCTVIALPTWPFSRYRLPRIMCTSSASASRLAARRQLFDGEVDLVGDEEVQAEDVVRRLARAPPIDPGAAAQLVALPGLADGQPDQQRDQRREQRRVGAHARCALRLVQIRGDDAVPVALRAQNQLDQLARGAAAAAERADPSARAARTSSTASAGAADRPTRASTARSTMSSPM